VKPLARPVGAVAAGGSVLVSTGLLIPQLPPVLAGLLIGTEFAALVVLTWSLNRRQKRAQEGAVHLLRELRYMPSSAWVVVRANGQIEAEVRWAEQGPPAEVVKLSEQQLIYQGTLNRKTSTSTTTSKARRPQLEPGLGIQTTSATETTGP
jgi:hypothetical protein